MRKRDRLFLLLTLFAGIAAGVLARYGSWGVVGEWQWQRRSAQIIALLRWWPPLIPGALLIALAVWRLRRTRRGARAHAAWCIPFVVLAFALQLSVLATAPFSTVRSGAVILSPVATTYFEEAGKIMDLRDFLRTYPEHMRAFSQHAQTYPPGPIVLFWLVQQPVLRSDAIQSLGVSAVQSVAGVSMEDINAQLMGLFGRPVSNSDSVAAILSAGLLGLLGCLSIVPLFLLARARWGDAAAVCAAALVAVVPSLILFTPSILQVTTFEAALALFLFDRALARRSPAWGAAAGVAWAASLLTSFAMLALPPLLVLWALACRFAPRQGGCAADAPARSAWPLPAAWVAGAAATFAVAYVGLGINLPATMTSALEAHRQVTTHAFARTYWRWLGWNLFDFWMFLGAGLGLWVVRQLRAEAVGKVRGADVGLTPLLWAVAVTLLALDASGIVRAEVGRIWMFLMLPLAASAGRFVAAQERPGLTLTVIMIAQLAQIWAFQRSLDLLVVL